MKKEKVYRVANRTMDEDSYKEFVSLTYEKQLETIYEGMSPKNMEEAEKALKKVPNGGSNISKGSPKSLAIGNGAADKGTGEASGNARPQIASGKD